MFARIITLNLKTNHLNDFKATLEKQVLPMLHKQTGFKHMITFAGPSGTEIRTVSFWDKKETAETYNTTGYPEVLKTLANVLEGTPQLKTYEVVNSTFSEIPVLATV